LAMMISSPAAAFSTRRDKWVFAAWMFTVDKVVRSHYLN
jgi:hypothetical protein